MGEDLHRIMAKIIYAIMLIFSLEFAMYLFAGTTYGKTSLLALMFEGSITASTLYTVMIVIIGAFAAATIIVGNFININIYALYAAMILVFISFVQTLTSFKNLIASELTEVLSVEMITILQGVLVFPLIVFYIIACVEWIRSNQL